MQNTLQQEYIHVPDIPERPGGLCEREFGGITAGVSIAGLLIGGINVLMSLMIVIIVLWKKKHSHVRNLYACYITHDQKYSTFP